MDKQFYSQAGQDQAAYELFGDGGYFLDFGCNHPHFHNNTFALEESGWRGVLVDYDNNCVEQCKGARSELNFYKQADLTQTDFLQLLEEAGAPTDIEYVSMDADSANKFIIENFPFDKYNIGLITFEHDLYHLGPELKELAREILTKHGFELYKENVVAAGYGEFEDWWINPKFAK